MAKAVVVGYATKWGSTRKVAEAVAPVLRERGLAGEVRPAREIRNLGPHGGVALGGALYRGRWHREPFSTVIFGGVDRQAGRPA